MLFLLQSLFSSKIQAKYDENSVNNLVAYSAVWAFGGFVSPESKPMLSEIIKDIYQIKLSPEFQHYSVIYFII